MNDYIIDSVIQYANSFVGTTEVEKNKKWNDNSENEDFWGSQLKEILKYEGLGNGEPYCAGFIIACHRQVSKNLNIKNELWFESSSNHCLTWFNKAKKNNLTTTQPSEGCVGIMQLKNSSNGHAFLIEKIDDNFLYTIEANTSYQKSENPEHDRNGEGIWNKKRSYKILDKNSLHIIGYIKKFQEE